MTIINIKINGRDITIPQGKNILQAALENGIHIPHLCFDERVKPYGACGLCVVEIEGNPKLMRACSVNASEGMSIKTDTPRIASTRKTALKLLVSDHRGDCRPPCVLACPSHTDCQGYVGLIANGQYDEAVELIKEQLPLPASIGRVCPHPCETACRRTMVEEPISIAALKTFVGDYYLNGQNFKLDKKPSTGKKVAIVGAGPSGLTCAFFLAREGHSVTIFEAMPKPGGMLRYGIPKYRLPKEILDQEVMLIEKTGVEIRYNIRLGKDLSLEGLKDNFHAVYLALGAWESSEIRCKGEDMEGVLGGIDFLREVSMNGTAAIGNRVLVVGGGNTAMDVARTAVRLGAQDVSVIYRRTREEMPAEDIEIIEAEEEGVKFNYLYAPIEVMGEGNKAAGLKCQRMRLGEPDASGRRKPEPIPGEEVLFEADTIIAAIGQKVTLKGIDGLKPTKHGTIEVNEGTFQTNIPGVFAGGDAVTGPKIAIEAVVQGKNCAMVIDGFLHGNLVPCSEKLYVKQEDLTEKDFEDRQRMSRVSHAVLIPEVRKHNFDEVSHTIPEAEARKEASRCLECGCRDYFECQLLKYIDEYGIDPQKAEGEKHKRKETDNHPFIERNSDKCILCGLCVRTCEEVMGITALGLVDRGFDAIVKPEFGLPLKESSCISCGLCASVCPTGACMEKEAVDKQVPLNLKTAESICSYCGTGCRLLLETMGQKVYRALPYENNLLCARGRFGIWHINDEERLLQPIVRSGNSFSEISYDEAIEFTVERLKKIVNNYGRDSVAIASSPGMTNEEARLVKEISQRLGTRVAGSFTHVLSSPSLSTAAYDDLGQADLIITIGSVQENHPVMGVKIKNAEISGAKLITLSTEDISKDSIAKMCEGAKQPVAVIDEDTVSSVAAAMIAGIDKLKVITARSKSNSQGLVDLGLVVSGDEILERIGQDKVKALVIIGEDPVGAYKNTGELFKNLEFMITADLYMTDTARLSDLILPITSFAENGGSFTRCDGLIQSAAPVIKPRTGRTNTSVLQELIERMDIDTEDLDVAENISSKVNPGCEKIAICDTVDLKFRKYVKENEIKI